MKPVFLDFYESIVVRGRVTRWVAPCLVNTLSSGRRPVPSGTCYRSPVNSEGKLQRIRHRHPRNASCNADSRCFPPVLRRMRILFWYPHVLPLARLGTPAMPISGRCADNHTRSEANACSLVVELEAGSESGVQYLIQLRRNGYLPHTCLGDMMTPRRILD